MDKRAVIWVCTVSAYSLLGLSPQAGAEEAAASERLARFCETSVCRGPGEIRLTTNDGHVAVTRFDTPLPIVSDDGISIFPGESLLVEADAEGDRLVNLRAVRQIRSPEKTIALRMWQEPGKPDTFLSVSNPFPRTWKFHLVMILPDSEKVYETSSCPVLGGGMSSYEHWPHPVFQLLLFDHRLLERGVADFDCEF
jgi:hypothetical protein